MFILRNARVNVSRLGRHSEPGSGARYNLRCFMRQAGLLVVCCGLVACAGKANTPNTSLPGGAASVAGSVHQAPPRAPKPAVSSLAATRATAEPQARPEVAPEPSHPRCKPAAWSRDQPLAPLLRSRNQRRSFPVGGQARLKGSPSAIVQRYSLFVDTAVQRLCGDGLGQWKAPALPVSRRLGDLSLSVLSARYAGKSGRNWEGGHCRFSVQAMAFKPVPPVAVIESPVVPPFNDLTTVERDGTALWFSLGFNGYAREFNGKGCRIVAVDLCAGKVRWVSPDLRSNGPVMAYGEYLITAYGFTAEPDYLYVFDKRTGHQVQRLGLAKAAEEFAVVRDRLMVRTYDSVEEFQILSTAGHNTD